MTQAVIDSPIKHDVPSLPPGHMGLPLPHGKLAMWLFLITEIMFFTGLIGVYLILRNGQPSKYEPWPAPHDVHLVEALGAINTFVLICSSLTVVLAHHALAKKKLKAATVYIGITLALGFVFLGIKAVEYKAKFEHQILPGRIYEKLDGPTGARYVNHVREQLEKIVKDPAKYTRCSHLEMWSWGYFLRQVDKQKADNGKEKADLDAALKSGADFTEVDPGLAKLVSGPREEKKKIEAAFADPGKYKELDPKLAAEVAKLDEEKAGVEKDYVAGKDFAKIDPELAKTLAGLKKDKNPEAAEAKAIAAARGKKIAALTEKATQAVAAARKLKTAPLDEKIAKAVDARKTKLDDQLAASIKEKREELAKLFPELEPVIDSWRLLELLPTLTAKKLNLEVCGFHDKEHSRDKHETHGDHHAINVAPCDQVKGYHVQIGLLEKHPDLPVSHAIPYGNMWASCYFAMTGFHAIHVLGGLVIFVIILIMAAVGSLGPQHESLFELTGLYWHFVDIVWIFLFPLLYLV